jgi:hypothetical protein
MSENETALNITTGVGSSVAAVESGTDWLEEFR